MKPTLTNNRFMINKCLLKYLFLLSLLSLSFLSCKNKPAKTQQEVVLGKSLATPIYLQLGKTPIILSDYILEPQKIDSIAKSPDYQVERRQNSDTIYINPSKKLRPISNFRIYAQGSYYDIPLFKSTQRKHIFKLKKSYKYKKVGFKSQIVGWQNVPMQQDNENWYYSALLDPGNYQYLFVVDGKEILDPSNTEKIGNGAGGFNSLLSIKDQSDKAPFLTTEKQAGNRFELQSNHPVTQVLAYLDNQLIDKENINIDKDKISIKIPKTHKERSFVRVFAYNEFGRSNDVLIPLEKGKIITDVSKLKRTDFRTQIMYFLMLDRFMDADKSNDHPIKSDSILPKVNFKGGDLQGVDKKIRDGYFKDLGINTIWISPILKNPDKAYGFWPDPMTKFSGYHGYWPVSNTQIDPRFGNEKAFKQLLSDAHQQNMNVLLDYVANHVHKDHPLYKQHPDWFTSMYLPDGTRNLEKWDSHRLTTWFDTFLPTIDFSKHQVVEAMTDSAAYWVTHYNLDGFRHDATKHIQLDFWRTLSHKIKTRTNRPIYQIGETYGSPQLIRSYVNTGMLDGQFNFNLYDAEVAVFAQKDAPMKRLSDALKESLKYFGYHHLMGNISGNQDRARFMSYASGDVKFNENAKKAGWKRHIVLSDTTAYHQLEMLHAFNMTTPGIPCIYYGDEYGMIGANDPDNRRMMQFSELDKHQNALKNKVKELIKLRKNSMALMYGSTQVEEKDNVLIIKRKYFNDTIEILFNKSNKTIDYQGYSIPANDYKIIKK